MSRKALERNYAGGPNPSPGHYGPSAVRSVSAKGSALSAGGMNVWNDGRVSSARCRLYRCASSNAIQPADECPPKESLFRVLHCPNPTASQPAEMEVKRQRLREDRAAGEQSCCEARRGNFKAGGRADYRCLLLASKPYRILNPTASQQAEAE